MVNYNIREVFNNSLALHCLDARSTLNPMLALKQIHELDDHIGSLYDLHTAKIAGPLDPIEEIHKITNTQGLPNRDAFREIDDSSRKHYQKLADLELDYAPVLASSFLVNLLTEDNLAYYHEEFGKLSAHSDAFDTWRRRWTAEEARHSMILYMYAVNAGIIDYGGVIEPTKYSEGMAAQHTGGMGVDLQDLAQAFAYTTIQEDATKVAHSNESTLLDPYGRRISRRVSADEARHEAFNSEGYAHLLEIYPDASLLALNVLRDNFSMPGMLSIPDFSNHAKIIAISGLFDPQTVASLFDKHIKAWNIADVKPISDEAKVAQESLLEPSKKLAKDQKVIDFLKSKAVKRFQTSGGLRPFILGETVDIKGGEIHLLDAA